MDWSTIKPDADVGAVLCGFDAYVSTYSPPRIIMLHGLMIDYKKYSKAYSYLRDNEDCHFLLTNQDKVFPTGGTTWPGKLNSSQPSTPLTL
jgi:4-nitrophenyl phosphatase